MNFEELLKKYMRHVIDAEGISYASPISVRVKLFTPEEQEYLISVDKALYEEEQAEYERWKAETDIP